MINIVIKFSFKKKIIAQQIQCIACKNNVKIVNLPPLLRLCEQAHQKPRTINQLRRVEKKTLNNFRCKFKNRDREKLQYYTRCEKESSLSAAERSNDDCDLRYITEVSRISSQRARKSVHKNGTYSFITRI